ncbi:protein WHAT'S THIS FACTOR 9, mitochondrial isoform X2 [Andrographis paniculata]|uniref:protein WHAT'S THIS FACTOR 9, mitochondrial isoform X2 n=1 Tax=Andrographis paniculata TaxID=175694 RepID=UPI0021E7D424|nr:protein WHAT'S THIS FACTOR 9, mitochondrial isoform X2 [Andrographis paniculata]
MLGKDGVMDAMILQRLVQLSEIRTYVEVYMKWKKDPYFDSIDSIHRSLELKPVISVKNFFISSASSPQDNYSIPISAISKRGSDFGISMKVARFLRSYPSFFEEFKGPHYDLPWFRLTQKAIDLDTEERMIYNEFRCEIVLRLKKLILMSGSRKVLPLKVIKGLRWYLGLPDTFWEDPLHYVEGYGDFGIVDMGDGLKGLAVLEQFNDIKSDRILSVMQKNAMKKGVYNGGTDEGIAFPSFPSKGLRLKKKIKDWSNEFQRLPYVSPYDDSSHLNPDSDISEKRVVGLLHELLCLFVEHAAERKSLFSLRKWFGLPQKVHKAFERHPHIFYLSFNNKTCTAILKEAYCDKLAIEPHPLANVREKYIALMKESNVISRNKRMKNCVAVDSKNVDDMCCDHGSPLIEETFR